MIYQRVARPALFRLGGGDAERAHEWTLRRLAALSRRPAALRALRATAARGTPRTVFGLRFPNPVGLAAGMDKDGRALPAWAALGFGFVEVGTVTARPQPGNPRPRVFRLPASQAVINRMGFNNEGAAALATRLATLRPLSSAGMAPLGQAPRLSSAGMAPLRQAPRLGIPLGVSLGKSKVVPLDDAVEDYLAALRAVLPYADYVAVNVSSPNTPGLRGLQDRAQLSALLAALRAESGTTPVLVKIAPDLTEHAIGEALEVCAEHGVAGLIATNTTIKHDGEQGGLSGRPLTGRALEVVTFVAKHSELPVVGVGGIMSVDDALRMLDAGASLVQLYTGLIYRGPSLLRAIVRATR